jgi:LAS superfamily LD-carboxypeptidase LdcB
VEIPRIQDDSPYGIGNAGLVLVSPDGPQLHTETWEAFLKLQKAAEYSGFKLRIESGYRTFERQCSIWNRKAKGELSLLDPKGKPLHAADLDPLERMWAILYWSALPGTSRHHWGSDLDIVDGLSIPPGYEVQLTPAETAPDGIFGPLHAWLDHRIQTDTAFGFTRPYEEGRGRVQPEKWHLSHRPTAAKFAESFHSDRLYAILEQRSLELWPEVKSHFDEILYHYCQVYFP